MGIFTLSVNTSSFLEKRLRGNLQRLRPKYYRRFDISDFPDIREMSGILVCRGTIFLRLLGIHYTHSAIYSKGTVYQATDGTGVCSLSFQDFVGEYVHHYNQIHFLRLNPSFNETDLDNQYRKFAGLPYETSGEEFVKAGERANKTESNQSFFCSEFVAKMLQEMGILDKKRLADNYTPDDMTHLELESGYTLGLVF
jgi:hypothetical protein